MDHPSVGDVASQEVSRSMKSRLIVDYYHRLNILALSCFNPSTLFHKINALPWYLGLLRTWSDSLGYRTGDSVLDVGCATGQLTTYMAHRGVVAYGVDKSTKMLQKANTSDIDGARFELASALDLPFENKRFDYVIAASLINIISEPTIALIEMARVCKPDGKVSVLVPQAGITDEDVASLANYMNLTGFSRAALTAWHRRAPKMQQEKLLEYFSNAGFHNTYIETYLGGMVMTVTGTSRING